MGNTVSCCKKEHDSKVDSGKNHFENSEFEYVSKDSDHIYDTISNVDQYIKSRDAVDQGSTPGTPDQNYFILEKEDSDHIYDTISNDDQDRKSREAVDQGSTPGIPDHNYFILEKEGNNPEYDNATSRGSTSNLASGHVNASDNIYNRLGRDSHLYDTATSGGSTSNLASGDVNASDNIYNRLGREQNGALQTTNTDGSLNDNNESGENHYEIIDDDSPYATID